MSTPRALHTATLLLSGKVLVAGGVGSGGVLASAELYDPVLGTWSAAGGMTDSRYYHTATLLSSGKVLVAGGLNCFSYLTSAELYDTTTGTWSATGSMGTARYEHTATPVASGRVLVAGGTNGISLASAELYQEAPTAATLTLAPTSATNPVGTQHCVTATVKDASGTAVPSVTVRFKVTGSVNTGGSAPTNTSGRSEERRVG